MKTVKRITVLLAVLLFASYQGFSQNTTATQKDVKASTKATPGKFVDVDKDGVCDNYHAKMNTGRGANFVDKNGDGICDNRGNTGKGQGNHNGCGMGYQHRDGQGHGNCCGRGNGYQHRHGRGN